MDPTELAAAARQLLATADPALGASSLVAAALLLRQAVEESIRAVWAEQLPSMRPLSARAQHITLPYYLDPAAAKELTYAWNRLSDLCHHSPGPTNWPSIGELRSIADHLVV